MSQLKNGTTFSPMKLILLGSSAVGKSQILHRLNGGTFENTIASTIGVEFLGKMFFVKGANGGDGGGGKVKAQIWDTAGQEKYRSLTKMYFRDAQVALIVFDLTNKHSFLEC